jgi:hypothetical protein
MTSALCLYCNELLPDLFFDDLRSADGAFYDGTCADRVCPNCGKTICVSVNVHIAFSVEKAEEDV